MRKICFYIVFVMMPLLWSCQNQPPVPKVQVFYDSIRRHDIKELDSARVEVREAKKDVERLEQLVETYRKKFVFEKVEKYHTVGYWVLPTYKGSKVRFTFFPEVEETGKMLLVNIDGKRRYTFTEVNLDKEDYEALLPEGLSQRQLADVAECYNFAKTMKLLDEARERQERMELKVRFYERKLTEKPR